jgi:hypothetical protein
MAANPTIQLKRKITSGIPSSLSLGEPAVNTADNQLFVGVNSSGVKWIGAEIENSSTNGTTWNSDLKLATKKAIGDYFAPLSGATFTGDISLSGGSDIRFTETGGGTDYVAVQAPSVVSTGNVTLTLPGSYAAADGYVLSSTTTGTLSWISAGSATSVTITSDDTSTTRYVVLGSAGASASLYVDDSTTPLSYNPNTATLTVSGDLAVNGSDITTSGSGTATLFNTNALTLNLGGAATAMTMGDSTTSTVTIRGGTLVGNTITQNAFNTTATTLNLGGAATAITMGDSTTATTTIRGGTIVGNTSTQDVFDTTATTVNAFGASTTCTIGHDGTSNSTTNIATGTTAALGTKTLNLATNGNASATVNINIGTTGSGTCQINSPSTDVQGDLTVRGGDIISTTATANLINTNTTTLNLGGVATAITMGDATTSTVTIRGGTLVGNLTTQNVFNTTATTVNAFGAATSITMGDSTTATTTIRGGTLVGNTTTQNVFNTTATTINAYGAATTATIGYGSTASSTTNISTGAVGASNTKTLNLGTGGASSSTTNVNIGSANGGTVTINSDAVVSGNLTVNGTTTTVSSTTITVNDPLIALANNNSSTDIVDIGFYGLYDTSGSQDLYCGLFRDASDDKFKLFKSLQSAPTTTVNTSGTGFAVSTLVAYLEGKVNGLTVTSSTGTLTVTNGKTLSVSNTLTFTGTDSSSVAFGTGGTVVYTSNNLSVFSATTSSQLAGVISDETGSGVLVFGTSPSFTTSVTTGSTTFGVFDATATTIDAFGAATTGNIGYDGTASSTTNISTGAAGSGNTKTLNLGTGAAASSTTNVNIGSSNGGTTTINSGTIVGSAGTQALFNTTATTMNFAGAATALTMGATTGTASIRN